MAHGAPGGAHDIAAWHTNSHRVGSRANITAPTPGLRKTRHSLEWGGGARTRDENFLRGGGAGWASLSL
eukprot:gene12831-biopygen9430